MHAGGEGIALKRESDIVAGAGAESMVVESGAQGLPANVATSEVATAVAADADSLLGEDGARGQFANGTDQEFAVTAGADADRLAVLENGAQGQLANGADGSTAVEAVAKESPEPDARVDSAVEVDNGQVLEPSMKKQKVLDLPHSFLEPALAMPCVGGSVVPYAPQGEEQVQS